MPRTADPLISLVIPCYNEEAALPLLIERITRVAAAWPVRYEVVCVDDGSRDRTWDLLQAQAAADSRWRCFTFSRNFGHQAAVSAGLKQTQGNAAIVIDADLQDPPEVLMDFVRAWQNGADVAYGVRESRKDPAGKKLFAWLFYRALDRMVRFKIPSDAGDFAILDRKVIDVLNALPERSRYLRGLRAWAGFKQVPIRFKREARAAGVPQYTFRKSMRLALDGMLSFSAKPLRLASYLGFIMSGFSLLLTVFTLLQRIFHEFFESIGLGPGPGFATIVIMVTMLGGVQLICLGIVGEYLGRIYDEVKRRPAWIIRDTTDSRPAVKATE